MDFDLFNIAFYGIMCITILGFLGICGCAVRMFWGPCKSRLEARNAIPLPPEEAQQIINSMQGDWDLTVHGMPFQSLQMIAGPPTDRMTVDGSMAVSKFRRGRHMTQLVLRPAKLEDGTLILDTSGTKAVVFTPEQGYIESISMGYKCEWRKVVSGGAGAPAPAAKVSSSGAPNVVEELARLNQLKQQGGLTEEEFAAAKFKVLNPGVEAPSSGPSAFPEKPPPYPGNQEVGGPSAPSAPLID